MACRCSLSYQQSRTSFRSLRRSLVSQRIRTPDGVREETLYGFDATSRAVVANRVPVSALTAYRAADHPSSRLLVAVHYTRRTSTQILLSALPDSVKQLSGHLLAISPLQARMLCRFYLWQHRSTPVGIPNVLQPSHLQVGMKEYYHSVREGLI